MRILLLLLLLPVCGGANALAAQPLPEPGPKAFGGHAGASFGTPLKASATLGLMHGTGGGIDGWWGESLVADIGLGGGKLRLARYSYGANIGREYAMAVLHTWGDPWQVSSGQTFVGAEVQTGALPLTLSLGGFVRVRGGESGDRLLVSASLGARMIQRFWRT